MPGTDAASNVARALAAAIVSAQSSLEFGVPSIGSNKPDQLFLRRSLIASPFLRWRQTTSLM